MDKFLPDIPNPYGYIYCVTNNLTGMQYVGQRGKPYFDKSYWGSGVLIKQAIEQYGKHNFTIQVLEWLSSRAEMNARETYWIQQLNTQVAGYNLDSGGGVADGFSSKAYWKVDLAEFLKVLKGTSLQQLDVVIHILENTRPSSNTYMGSRKKIAQRVGVSLDTVDRIMKKLLDLKFLKMVQPGVYQVSPKILMRGSENKRQVLLSYYDEAPKEQLVRRPIIQVSDNDWAEG